MAKKRHHSSKVARRHESEGMERREHSEMGHHNGAAGYGESRKMMARDGAMIREDMSAPALLPQRIIDQYWPKANNYNMGYVDDLFYGAQKQMHEDYEDLHREMKPGKY